MNKFISGAGLIALVVAFLVPPHEYFDLVDSELLYGGVNQRSVAFRFITSNAFVYDSDGRLIGADAKIDFGLWITILCGIVLSTCVVAILAAQPRRRADERPVAAHRTSHGGPAPPSRPHGTHARRSTRPAPAFPPARRLVRFGRRYPFVAVWMGLIVLAFLIPEGMLRNPVGRWLFEHDSWVHAGLLFGFAWGGMRLLRLPAAGRAVLILLVGLVLSGGFELLQGLLPIGRSGSMADFAANVAGLGLGVGAYLGLRAGGGPSRRWCP